MVTLDNSNITPSQNGASTSKPTPTSTAKKVGNKPTTSSPSSDAVVANPTIAPEKELALIEELKKLKGKKDIVDLFKRNQKSPKDILSSVKYQDELKALQIELVKMQRWVQEKGIRLAILFEGRDAAGKGGTIRRFTEHLNPRSLRIVALPKPTEEEKGQWYFQRYVKQLPNKGEIVFFDRSWYNRAVVEPVMGFCSENQYQSFLQQVPELEHMLYEDGIIIIKFWFSISKEEQLKRFNSRRDNPLKQWKLSPVDMEAQKRWNEYTKYKEQMFGKTHNSYCPWIIVKANSKEQARLASIKYVLSQLPYDGKDKSNISLLPDPNVIGRYHRNAIQVDF